MWLSRLRWRLRGAWQWPAFAILTVVDAFVVHWMPFSGHDGSDVVAGFIICGFLNLGLVAVGAPLLGRAVRKRSPQLPASVAADRAAVLLMGGLTAILLVAGVAHHGAVGAADDDEHAAISSAREFARVHAPDRFLGGIGRENVLDTGARLYRICLAGPDPKRNFCMFVDFDGDAPRVHVDSDQSPNSVLAGPDNPGRQAG